MTRALLLSLLPWALATSAAAQEPTHTRMQYRGEPVETDAPLVGETVPDLEITDLDGTTATLTRLAGPRGLVIVIRDSGCPVSRRYGPRLARFEREYAEAGFSFLYVNPTRWESEADARTEIADYGFGSPYVLDGDARVARALRAQTSTEVFVLDSGRTLIYRGAVDDQYGIGYSKPEPRRPLLRDALAAVVAGELPEVRATIAPGCYLGLE